MLQVATIRTIARYPVKSMRGEELASTELSLQALPGDRRYAFVQAKVRGLFPWLTAREFPRMLLYRPAYEDPASQRSLVFVTTPSGATLPIDSEELRRELEEGAGRQVYLMADHRGSFDVAPVSLIALATIARIAADSETPFDPARFRANFYLETPEGAAFAEDRWVGRVLRLGDTARLAVTEADQRCLVITLDPQTGASDPKVLRAVARAHANRAGVYGAVLTSGTVRSGDPVYLEADSALTPQLYQVAATEAVVWASRSKD
jgi:uncharacterized protein YcbX